MEQEIGKTDKNRYQAVVLVVLLLLGVGVIVLLQTKESTFSKYGRSQLKKGALAPNFVLPDLNGREVDLASLRGKVVLLNIWATWCPPCVEEMPSMEKLYQALKDQDFEILAVSIDASGAGVVAPFMKKHRLSFTTLTDTEGGIARLYQTTGIPESFIIDKQGRILEKVIGPRDWASADALRYFRNLIQAP